MSIYYSPVEPEARPDPKFPLGRYVYHDPRSRQYPVRATTVAPCSCGCPHCCAVPSDSSKARSVLWMPVIPALNQGNLGSCTGCAMAHVLAAPAAGRPGPRIEGVDIRLAVQIYSGGTHLDEIPGTYPPIDTGGSGLGVMKYARSRGWVRAYRHAFNLGQVLLALKSTPLITGFAWREGLYYPDEEGLAPYTGPVVGGHEVAVIGCDIERELLIFRNSWGPEWGVDGNFTMTFTDYERALADRGDATVPVW